MKINYEVRRVDNIVTLKIWTSDTICVDGAVFVSNSISEKDFIKAGNIIDKSTVPFNFCYVTLKEFYHKISQGLLTFSEYIQDEELKNRLVAYTKSILLAEVEIMTLDTFEAMLKEVENITEDLK